MILGSLLAGAAYTWFAGEDINWDWRNYHEYSAFALIHGRFNEDVAPAGIQTFLNPLGYLPAYLAAPSCCRAVLGNAARRHSRP